MSWFPFLLVAHICLAVALLAPSLLLPFLLRRSTAQGPSANPGMRVLMAMQGTGSLVVAGGLALTGAGLLAILGAQLLTKPWLLLALTIYAVNLVVAAFVSRPNLRRLVWAGAGADDETWRRRARTQRYVAYGMAAATGVIGFLMSTKPELW
ncbi:MAG TPA: hypothetical protein VHU77_09980 [Candidatus Limnocylindria bacterium]|nr:hypothetical protein [Candidatus Limnocylindria bacterium]